MSRKVFSRRLKWVKVLFVVIITGALICIILYAPHYLAYSDRPKRSDAVVLLVGPDFEARKKEGHRLFKDGYADYIIIPAYGRILKASIDGSLTSVKNNHGIQETPGRRKNPGEHADLFEDTHLEILYAKGMMDVYGLKSAIFVSSPYHMRRIKIMAGRIFDQRVYDCSFVLTRYEKRCDNLWWTNRYCLKWVMDEYIKIGWFLLYEPFVEN